MFTGIVEETGSIRSLRLSGSSGKIAIRAKKYSVELGSEIVLR